MIVCRIVTPNGLYKEVETSICNIRNKDGELGILSNHMPLVTSLEISKMTLVEDGKRIEYAVGGGLFYFKDNVATVLTDSIERSDEIDVERATKAKDRAEKRLKEENSDIKRAEMALKRALNRLKVKGNQ